MPTGETGTSISYMSANANTVSQGNRSANTSQQPNRSHLQSSQPFDYKEPRTDPEDTYQQKNALSNSSRKLLGASIMDERRLTEARRKEQIDRMEKQRSNKSCSE